jgi:uncharacterized membrane protein YdjX (TVP38/TMEM64 family)
LTNDVKIGFFRFFFAKFFINSNFDCHLFRMKSIQSNQQNELEIETTKMFSQRTKGFLFGISLISIFTLYLEHQYGLLYLYKNLSFQNFMQFINKLDPITSYFVLLSLLSITTPIFISSTPFNFAFGFLFQSYLGTLGTLIGCMIGASISFFLARYFLTEWVHENSKAFNSLFLAIEQKGLLIVFLTRLAPVFPFPLLNYAYGVTKLSFFDYFFGTFFGLIPSVFVYSYFGSTMRNLTSNSNLDTKWMLLGLGISLLSIVYISFVTKKQIDQITRNSEKDSIESQ